MTYYELLDGIEKTINTFKELYIPLATIIVAILAKQGVHIVTKTVKERKMKDNIEDINNKFGIHFVEKGNGKYTYTFSEDNILEIDLNTGTVDTKKWYGGANKNGPWDKQPRREQDLEGLIHNLLSIDEKNKDNWKPPY